MGGLALIARLVSEEVFGVYRQIIALHVIALTMLPLGFDQLVIREAGARAQYNRALCGALTLAGTTVVLAVVLGHAWLARALDLGGGANLLWAVSLVVPIQAAKLAYKPSLAARLAFGWIATAEFVNTAITFFGGCLALLVWKKPEALYAMYAAGEIFELVLLHRASRADAPQWLRIKRSVQEFARLAPQHSRFCAAFTVDQGLNAFSSNAPALMLGGLVGAATVGAFAMASALIMAPMTLLVGAVSRVTLPALAGLPEKEIHRRALLVLRSSAAFTAPGVLGIAMFAPELTQLLLGVRWTPDVAPMVPWLAVYLVLVSLFSPISSIDVLRDRPEITLAWDVGMLFVRVVALAAGARHGAVAAVAAFSVASAAMWLLYGGFLAWLLGCGWWRFHIAWLRYVPFWAALCLAWGLLRIVPGIGIVWLLVSGVLSAAVYMAVIVRLDADIGAVLRRIVPPRESFQ